MRSPNATRVYLVAVLALLLATVVSFSAPGDIDGTAAPVELILRSMSPDGSTTSTGTVDLPTGINVQVISERTSEVLVGIPVRFSIISDSTDTAAFDRAEFAATGDTFTDSRGIAIIAHDSGAVIVIEAVARDPQTGDVIARSN